MPTRRRGVNAVNIVVLAALRRNARPVAIASVWPDTVTQVLAC